MRVSLTLLAMARMPRFKQPSAEAGSLTLAGRLELEVFVRAGRAPRLSVGRQRVPADVVAYFVVPKVAQATLYEVAATGFDDPGYYGHRFAMTFTPASAVLGRPPTTGFGDTTVRERGNSYWIPLSAVSSWVDAFAADWAALRARFAGAQIVATVTLA